MMKDERGIYIHTLHHIHIRHDKMFTMMTQELTMKESIQTGCKCKDIYNYKCNVNVRQRDNHFPAKVYNTFISRVSLSHCLIGSMAEEHKKAFIFFFFGFFNFFARLL